MRRPQIKYDSEDLFETPPKRPKSPEKKVEDFDYNPFSPVAIEPENDENRIKEITDEPKKSEISKHTEQQLKPMTSFEKRVTRSDNKQIKKGPELASSDHIKNPFERRAFNIMRFWYPLKFKLPYPRKSLLNSFEQKEFIEFHMKFRNRVKVTQSEVKLYKKYLVWFI